LRRYIQFPLEPQRLQDIVKDAVEIEKEFVCDALSCALVGMNAELMSQYIEYVADRLMVQLGVPKVRPLTNASHSSSAAAASSASSSSSSSPVCV
jgi:ribonucleoside-diphosphate reductase subunit M2